MDTPMPAPPPRQLVASVAAAAAAVAGRACSSVLNVPRFCVNCVDREQERGEGGVRRARGSASHRCTIAPPPPHPPPPRALSLFLASSERVTSVISRSNRAARRSRRSAGWVATSCALSSLKMDSETRMSDSMGRDSDHRLAQSSNSTTSNRALHGGGAARGKRGASRLQNKQERLLVSPSSQSSLCRASAAPETGLGAPPGGAPPAAPLAVRPR